MRQWKYFLVLPLLFMLMACPPSRKSDLKQIQANNMDLPHLNYVGYEGIDFALSDLFDKEYSTEYAYSGDDAMCRVIRSLDVYFSVEVFGAMDVVEFSEEINSSSNDEIMIVQDFYVGKRVNSLYDPTVSIKKEVPNTIKFPGVIQVVKGKEYEYEAPTNYFTATLKVGNQYYVFQLIGKAENMGYLYDDFIDILSSVR